MPQPSPLPAAVRYGLPKPVSDWIEDGAAAPGDEANGLALPWHVLDAYARSLVAGRPCEFVVVGEERHRDGRRFLTFAASREFIEQATEYAHELDASGQPVPGGLHYRCPSCLKSRGGHRAGCERKAS
ncbi:MAG: hypothetical protein U0838_12905 [Chloroflexota bacterium]